MNLPNYIDIHAHTNFSAFDADREAVIKRAHDAGVWLINVGTQKDTSAKAVEIANQYKEGVYATVAVHPVHTGKSYHDEKELGPSFAKASEGKPGFTSRGEVFDTEYYRQLGLDKKVVAIGECGLDFYREIHDSGFRIQEEIFRKHIELAIELGKPLMLHVRNGSGRSAYEEVVSILKSYIINHKSSPGGNVHFFAGTWDEAKKFLDLGFTLSFTGVITFARDYDEVIKNMPLDRIMSETDCPYVSPAPYRGKRNEPAYVVEVVKAIAAIRGEDLEKVKKALVSNAFRVFSL